MTGSLLIFLLAGFLLAVTFGWWIRGVCEAIDDSDPHVPPYVVDRASRATRRSF
jgi:hypothetical protein